MTSADVNILERLASAPVMYLVFSQEEWLRVVELGKAGLVAWPVGDVFVRLSADGRAAMGIGRSESGVAA